MIPTFGWYFIILSAQLQIQQSKGEMSCEHSGFVLFVFDNVRLF